MRSILLTAVAAAVFATSPTSAAAPGPDPGAVNQADTAGNPDADPSDQSGQYPTELDVVPTLVCGMMVSEDQKTIDELVKNERSQADGCRIRSLPDDSLFSTQADLSDIA